MFMKTNRTRMILPEECARFRFGVGHAEFGLMYFKPLSDSHLAQHFAMLGIVPTEVRYMIKATSENNGSPLITRVLRDREEQADMASTFQRSGSAACTLATLARAKAVQDLVVDYEKSVGAAAPANLAESFEQVSGEAQYGGAPKNDVPTVVGGGPAAFAQAGSLPAVGTIAHNTPPPSLSNHRENRGGQAVGNSEMAAFAEFGVRCAIFRRRRRLFGGFRPG
jgi:hypothetical protein